MTRSKLEAQVLRAAEANKLRQAKPIRPADQAYQNRDLDRGYWHSWSQEPDRRGWYEQEDDQLFEIPTGEMLPVGAEPQNRLWVAGTDPMWNHPPFWSKPFSYSYTLCVPTWEEEYNMGTLIIPEMKMGIIKGISYDVVNGLQQLDVFEFAMYDPAKKIVWEDAYIDTGTFDPSEKFAFAGDTRPQKVDYHLDRNKTVRFTVKARGVVTLAGVSNHAPGDPLIPNATFRLSVFGYFAPLRRNVDGGPRPTDFGNADFVDMYDNTYLEGR